MKPTMYRQGDVLVISVGTIPEGTKQLPRDRGTVVLAYGEVTGHAHAIVDEGATLYGDDDSTYLRVVSDGGVALAHEEHDTILLPAGEYEVRRQREYAPEAPRYVTD
jgi:hypothetical protein